MSEPPSNLANVYRMATMGWEFVMAVLILGAIGYGMDWLFGTAPVLVVAGLVLGTVLGFYRFIHGARQAFKSQDRPPPSARGPR